MKFENQVKKTIFSIALLLELFELLMVMYEPLEVLLHLLASYVMAK